VKAIDKVKGDGQYDNSNQITHIDLLP